MTPFPEWVSVPSSFVSLFIFYILSYLLSKTMGWFSGCLMSSASGQKLFCEVFSVFKCSFDEFVGEEVVSPSYSSTILSPLPSIILVLEIPWTEGPGRLQSTVSKSLTWLSDWACTPVRKSESSRENGLRNLPCSPSSELVVRGENLVFYLNRYVPDFEWKLSCWGNKKFGLFHDSLILSWEFSSGRQWL